MHKRVNRWLSPDLIATSAPNSIEKTLAAIREREPILPTGMEAIPPQPHSGSRRRNGRRIWQRLAAVALLAGSAAFSYVAWSNSYQLSLPVYLSGNPDTDTAASAQSSDASNQKELMQLQDLRQDQVLLLREENQLLRQRVEDLHSSLKGPPP